jgi:LPXTG-site transpeptidase (sortase) family protein
MANPKSSRKKIRVFSLIFGIGSTLLGFFLILWASRQFVSSPNTPEAKIEFSFDQAKAKPTKIYIPKISRILSVSDGQVAGNRWTISPTGVSYLTSSAVPGKAGNSVMYGHNRNDTLGYLPNLKNDDIVYVVMDSGTVYKYKVFETKQIEPTQVEILNESRDARLTLYTCIGFLDQARFAIVAKLLDNQS